MKSRLHHAPRNDAMKCVRINGGSTIIRVSNEEADRQVRIGRGSYVPKSEWKAQKAKALGRTDHKG